MAEALRIWDAKMAKLQNIRRCSHPLFTCAAKISQLTDGPVASSAAAVRIGVRCDRLMPAMTDRQQSVLCPPQVPTMPMQQCLPAMTLKLCGQ